MPECKVETRHHRQDELYARYWREFLGDRPIEDLVPGDIVAWQATRLEVHVNSPATVNRQVAFLKKIFGKAVRDELLDRSPATFVKKLPENNLRQRFLSAQEAVMLRDAVPQERWPMVASAVLTGLRLGEMLRLRKDQVNLEFALATVLRGKNNRPHHVPLNQDALLVIKQQLELAGDSEWLFPGRHPGTHFSERGAQNLLERACQKAGIQDFHWHDLRHTAASWMVQAGETLQTVQEVLGHRSFAVTQRYAHLAPGQTRAAVDKLSHFFPGSQQPPADFQQPPKQPPNVIPFPQNRMNTGS